MSIPSQMKVFELSTDNKPSVPTPLESPSFHVWTLDRLPLYVFLHHNTFRSRFYPKRLTAEEIQSSHSDVVNYTVSAVSTGLQVSAVNKPVQLTHDSSAA